MLPEAEENVDCFTIFYFNSYMHSTYKGTTTDHCNDAIDK